MRSVAPASPALGGMSVLVSLPYEEAVPRARAALNEIAALPSDRLVGLSSEIGSLGAILWDETGRRDLLERASTAAWRDVAAQELDALADARSLAELWGGTVRRAVEIVGCGGNAPVMAWTAHPRDVVRSAAVRGGLHSAGVAALATRDLAEGRYVEAYDALVPLIEEPSLPAGPSYVPDLVEAAVSSGRSGVAERLVVDLEERARINGSVWCAGVAARSRALVAPVDKAETSYRAAIELLAGTTARTDLGRAHLVYGEWLRGAGRRVEAGRQLNHAYDLLELSGAMMFEPRVRTELAAAGADLRADVAPPCHELTSEELTIARLAGEGRTSAEIGDRLLISPNTVEHHLRTVCQKLGISSRRQLTELGAA